MAQSFHPPAAIAPAFRHAGGERVAAASTARPSVEWAGRWLYHPMMDIGILAVPVILVLAMVFVLASVFGEPVFGKLAQPHVGWMTQMLLGNTLHVVLTPALLGVRRDVLDATKGQARAIILSGIAAFAVSFCVLYATQIGDKAYADFGLSMLNTWAVYHYMSQVKGYMSMYNLRSATRPTAEEQTLQGLFRPLSVTLILVRMFLVPMHPHSNISLFNPVPLVPECSPIADMLAGVPYEVVWVSLGVWGVYAALLLRALVRSGSVVSGPKLLYTATHTLGVAVTLFSPAWGMMIVGGIHGLEYFAISWRMLQPRDTSESARFPAWAVIPFMLLTMLPLLVVGVLNAPFAKYIGVEGCWQYALASVIVSSLVVAHYAMDGIMYRLRIPDVRRVALRRLGFDPR